MFDTISKQGLRWILLLGFISMHTSMFCQRSEEFRSLKLVLGGGYGNYFNTFTNVSDQEVVNNRPSFCGKLLWQPEYRLRIGIESGYYMIYSTTRIETNNGTKKLTTNLSVIPIFLSLSMKVVNHLELNFATGLADMIYTININKSKTDKVVGHTFSMSNYATGFTYTIPLGKKIELGAEFKYMNLGKTEDSHISGLITISYKIFNWKIKN